MSDKTHVSNYLAISRTLNIILFRVVAFLKQRCSSIENSFINLVLCNKKYLFCYRFLLEGTVCLGLFVMGSTGLSANQRMEVELDLWAAPRFLNYYYQIITLGYRLSPRQ